LDCRRKQIPRSARNDNLRQYFRSLPQHGLSLHLRDIRQQRSAIRKRRGRVRLTPRPGRRSRRPVFCSPSSSGSAHSYFASCPALSSRPERPDLFFRAAFWRVGPRSGGICSFRSSPRFVFSGFVIPTGVPRLLRHVAEGSRHHPARPPNSVIPNGVFEVRYAFASHAFCAMNLSSSWVCLYSSLCESLRRRSPWLGRGVIFRFFYAQHSLTNVLTL
jgi:hypothetical protein